MNQIEHDNVQALIDAASKLILDYWAEAGKRTVRYTTDEKNINAIAEALKPFMEVKPFQKKGEKP